MYRGGHELTKYIMAVEIEGFSKALKIFGSKKYELITEEEYKSVESLLNLSEKLVSETSKICKKYDNSGIIALGITDLITAKVENPESVFGRMLAFFKENGITTDVQTGSLRYKSAVCLSIYLQEQKQKKEK